MVLVGEAGLGKTRLVQECRKRFMAWVGARSGRLPLWLEARCASYASTTPYGLYQHLLAAWVGVAPDQGQAVVAPALERALTAVMGSQELSPPSGEDDGPGRRGQPHADEPPRAAKGDFRCHAGRCVPPGRRRANCAGAGGPALGRRHLAPADRGALLTGRDRPTATGHHTAART